MDSKSFLIQMLTTFTDGKKADKIQVKSGAVEEVQTNHAALMTTYATVREEIGKWLEAIT